MRHPSFHIFDHTPDSLAELLAERGLGPRYRADQILEWVYRRGIGNPMQMSNLPKLLRDTLHREMTVTSGTTIRREHATDGTRKLLVQWSNGDPTEIPAAGQGTSLPILNSATDTHAGPEMIAAGLGRDTTRETECVMIPADKRRTACISSQVGCPVGCRFCASGLGGLDANLSAGRIVEQVWRLNRLLEAEVAPDARITNIVFMGMGEPLSNYTAVVKAARTLIAPWAFDIGGRRVTISTVGLPPAMRRLADEGLPVTLALSLHAPNDELRRRLIPWAEYHTIEELLDAGRYYFRTTGREITLEYILLSGVNDQAEHAQQLARVARTLRSNINLIRYNEVDGLPFNRPLDQDVHRFQSILRERGINVHIRASRGRDIAAACGQLRHEKTPPPAEAVAR
ncbi:MAG: 23S rRNA (adenine(2503)-C(2))-methyltransferase RlmN [Planctomycetota bacterium]